MPRPMDIAVASSESEERSISTLSAMGTRSFSISPAVRPNSGERWLPVTMSFNSTASSSRSSLTTLRSIPYSARDPVTTATLRILQVLPLQYRVSLEVPLEPHAGDDVEELGRYPGARPLYNEVFGLHALALGYGPRRHNASPCGGLYLTLSGRHLFYAVAHRELYVPYGRGHLAEVLWLA